MFISTGHVWANVTVPGLVRVGMDDFARKMIGRITAIEFPAKDRVVQKGERLFAIQQNGRTAVFNAPITGTVHLVNTELREHLDWLEKQPYEKGWVCSLKPEHLANELEHLRLGEKAAEWYREEITRFRKLLVPANGNGHFTNLPEAQLVEGQLEEVDEQTWEKFSQTFLTHA